MGGDRGHRLELAGGRRCRPHRRSRPSCLHQPTQTSGAVRRRPYRRAHRRVARSARLYWVLVNATAEAIPEAETPEPDGALHLPVILGTVIVVAAIVLLPK